MGDQASTFRPTRILHSFSLAVMCMLSHNQAKSGSLLDAYPSDFHGSTGFGSVLESQQLPFISRDLVPGEQTKATMKTLLNVINSCLSHNDDSLLCFTVNWLSQFFSQQPAAAITTRSSLPATSQVHCQTELSPLWGALAGHSSFQEVVDWLPEHCQIHLHPGIYRLEQPVNLKKGQTLHGLVSESELMIPANPVAPTELAFQVISQGEYKQQNKPISYALTISQATAYSDPIAVPAIPVFTMDPSQQESYFLNLPEGGELESVAFELPGLAPAPGKICHQPLVSQSLNVRVSGVMYINGSPCGSPPVLLGYPRLPNVGSHLRPRGVMVKSPSKSSFYSRTSITSSKDRTPTRISSTWYQKGDSFGSSGGNGPPDQRDRQNEDDTDLLLARIDIAGSLLTFLINSGDSQGAQNLLARWLGQEFPAAKSMFQQRITQLLGEPQQEDMSPSDFIHSISPTEFTKLQHSEDFSQLIQQLVSNISDRRLLITRLNNLLSREPSPAFFWQVHGNSAELISPVDMRQLLHPGEIENDLNYPALQGQQPIPATIEQATEQLAQAIYSSTVPGAFLSYVLGQQPGISEIDPQHYIHSEESIFELLTTYLTDVSIENIQSMMDFSPDVPISTYGRPSQREGSVTQMPTRFGPSGARPRPGDFSEARNPSSITHPQVHRPTPQNARGNQPAYPAPTRKRQLKLSAYSHPVRQNNDRMGPHTVREGGHPEYANIDVREGGHPDYANLEVLNPQGQSHQEIPRTAPLRQGLPMAHQGLTQDREFYNGLNAFHRPPGAQPKPPIAGQQQKPDQGYDLRQVYFPRAPHILLSGYTPRLAATGLSGSSCSLERTQPERTQPARTQIAGFSIASSTCAIQGKPSSPPGFSLQAVIITLEVLTSGPFIPLSIPPEMLHILPQWQRLFSHCQRAFCIDRLNRLILERLSDNQSELLDNQALPLLQVIVNQAMQSQQGALVLAHLLSFYLGTLTEVHQLIFALQAAAFPSASDQNQNELFTTMPHTQNAQHLLYWLFNTMQSGQQYQFGNTNELISIALMATLGQDKVNRLIESLKRYFNFMIESLV